VGKESGEAMTASGAPERVVTPGDWNNISVCCGITGQAQFFLDMYQVTRNRHYLDFSRKASALLVAKSDSTAIRRDRSRLDPLRRLVCCVERRFLCP
jgi:hypothetical protein